jgi:long-chain acyl-CoA synthetase
MTPIEALYRRARVNPDGVAFVVGDDKWNYRWLAAQAERVALGLTRRGIREGDRIALHMPNRPEFVVAVYACFHIAAVAVPLNHKLKSVELRPLLEQSWPSLYIGDANLCGIADEIDRSILPQQSRIVVGGMREFKDSQSWASLLCDSATPLPVMADMDSPAVLLATSETPGVTRFVMHTQATLAALFGLPFMCGDR